MTFFSNYQQDYLPSSIKNVDACTEFGDVVTINGNCLAVVTAFRLSWDTNILSIPCARIQGLWCKDDSSLVMLDKAFKNVTTKIDNALIDFCDFRTGLHDFRLAHLAEKHNFHLMDVMNIYVSRTCPKPVAGVSETYPYRFVSMPDLSPQDIEQAAAIASNSFLNSRLYQDPRITKAVADHFYRELFLGFIVSDNSRVGIAYDENSNVAGFFIGRADFFPETAKQIGYLWLIAVSPEHHGKGLGKKLLSFFLSEMHSYCDLVEIGTQVTNRSANRLYQAAGLHVTANVATFHRWRT